MIEDKAKAKAKEDFVAIVVPVYNEVDSIVTLYQEIKRVISKVERIKLRLIFINDGSEDGSWGMLEQIANTDREVCIIDFSRNFGKEAALTAGVIEAEKSGCDAVICIDADFQHPPELIPTLLERWRNGAEMVIGIRLDTAGVSAFKKITSKIFHWVFEKISDEKISVRSTDFRICDRKVVRAFVELREGSRIFRGLMDWVGFKKEFISFQAPERRTGTASYTYRKLFSLAISTVTTFSLLPLKLTVYLGAFFCLSSTLCLLFMLIDRLAFNSYAFSNLAFVILVNTFLTGLVLIGLGLVATYVGATHRETMKRPLYILRESRGAVDPPDV